MLKSYSLIESFVIHFLGQILVCSNTISHYDEISVFCIFLVELSLSLYSFCASCLYSIHIWLIDPSLSLHSLHSSFSGISSIFALNYLILMSYFLLLLWEIQFLSLSFLFVAMSNLSLVQSRLKYPYSCFSSYFLVFKICTCVNSGRISRDLSGSK